MQRYDITLAGCDDEHTVTTELTPEQLLAVQRIVRLTAPGHESHSCLPKLTVTKHTEETTDE